MSNIIEAEITTTLEAIRKCEPCEDGWVKLLKHLGKTKADSEPLKFSTILESNGLDDALWCLRTLPVEHYYKIRHMAADYAERVLHIFEAAMPGDNRPRLAIEAARKFANGEIGHQERVAARAAAWEAAGDAGAAGVAAGAARTAAWAARAAAGEAAGEAAWEAAWAARAAAGDAGAAERSLQAKLLIKYFG
jgi:hypothetical protein